MENVMTPSTVLADLVTRGLIQRRWVCSVLRSGYHNGATCLPADPHEGWGCGFRWEMSLHDTPTIREMLGVSDDA